MYWIITFLFRILFTALASALILLSLSPAWMLMISNEDSVKGVGMAWMIMIAIFMLKPKSKN